MTNTYKRIILYSIFVLSIFWIYHFLDASTQRNIEQQKQILIQEAQTHFKSQSNTRKWNDSYLGVYVLSQKELQPHPYLPNSTLVSENNETLYRINHSSMARQLSEISDQNNFKFHLTSLNPLNTMNKADEFEETALKSIEENGNEAYYEFQGDTFRYLGAILTQAKCLECHAHQGYSVGDVRGGLSVTLNSKSYNEAVKDIQNRNIIIKVSIFLFLFVITFLMRKQIQSNELLTLKVKQRTKQINETKELLQNVLDADASLMMVSSGTEVILLNKTALCFMGVETLEEYRAKYRHISDVFKEVEDEDYLKTYMGKEHWIDYVQRVQKHKTLKVIIPRDGQDRHLKVHSKEITVNSQQIHIIIFDDITKELETIKTIKDEATRDPLTGLFNRGKFNNVLTQEIALSNTTNTPLSIIFLDIDHFKNVNDTYGHDVGDDVLVTLAELLNSVIRAGDFVSRWGGEEFVITLKATNASQAALVAEKLRVIVSEYNFEGIGQQTISLGVTEYKDKEAEKEFIKRVDTALYEAKNSGRNRVVIL